VLTHWSGVRRRLLSRSNPRRLVVGGVLAAAVLAGLATACHESLPSSSTRGSGVSVTDRREVAPFATVELAGSNTVAIQVGAPRSVAVTGDDNLVDRVTTVVRSGRLVIDDTGSFSTKAPMHVAVSVPSLDLVELSGAGTVTVDGVTGPDLSAELTGDGTLVVAGTARRERALLAGAGTLDLGDVAAHESTARLQGTGTIRVGVTSSLDATLSGTGTILYRGDPNVTVRNTGTGTVAPE
jgi:Putative auto-transporter adhesin, head GIN domain